MKVLFAVWELDPFLKIGGLGDVAQSLPAALSVLGVDIRIALPYYKVVKLGKSKKEKVCQFMTTYAGKNEKVEVFQVAHPATKIPVYLFKNKRNLDISSFPDTYAFFDKAIVEAVKHEFLHWTPDIIHCNDLHTALIPFLIKENRLNVKTMLTVHNLSYQGKAAIDILEKIGIDKSKCKIIQWEIASKQVNFLMEGIIHTDVMTTVSPTYAAEIMTEEFGAGLETVLRGKQGRVYGILNGIDDDWRNIMHDRYVKYPYMFDKINSWVQGKKLNKLYLQRKLGLKVSKDIPLLSFIGRFDPRQKGIDILHKMLRRMDPMQFEIAILGTGDVDWEERFHWLSKFYPKFISCNFKFDEALAHQIYTASDFILIPSKFEPCGLIQMIAMYFGTLPIAHKTGGLGDSIKDGFNGFLFDKYTSEALKETVERAVNLQKHNRGKYIQMVENALSTDFSWKKSAGKYLELYKRLVEGTL